MGNKVRVNRNRSRSVSMPNGMPPPLRQPPIGTTYCLICCQIAKKENVQNAGISVALTWQCVSIGGFPAVYPVCLEHLQLQESKLVTG